MSNHILTLKKYKSVRKLKILLILAETLLKYLNYNTLDRLDDKKYIRQRHVGLTWVNHVTLQNSRHEV